MSLLQDESSQGLREEARAVSEDDRLQRLNELKKKRDDLDLGVQGKLRFSSFRWKQGTSDQRCFGGAIAILSTRNRSWELSYIQNQKKFRVEADLRRPYNLKRSLLQSYLTIIGWRSVWHEKFRPRRGSTSAGSWSLCGPWHEFCSWVYPEIMSQIALRFRIPLKTAMQSD